MGSLKKFFLKIKYKIHKGFKKKKDIDDKEEVNLLEQKEDSKARIIKFKIDTTSIKKIIRSVRENSIRLRNNLYKHRKKIYYSLGVLGFMFVSFIAIKWIIEPTKVPEKVKITNKTEEGFTISWTTKGKLTKGAVYVYRDGEIVFPGITHKKGNPNRLDQPGRSQVVTDPDLLRSKG